MFVRRRRQLKEWYFSRKSGRGVCLVEYAYGVMLFVAVVS